MIRFFKGVLGLLMLPLCFAAARTVAGMALELWAGFPPSPGWLWFGGGFFFWLLLFLFLPPPALSYVLAHELTHALWARLRGYRVLGLRVSRRGGNVRLSGSDFLVTLSPYFFPLYLFAVLGLRALLALRFNQADYELFWLAAAGLTWSYHLTMTGWALRIRQPDLREQGRFFSYPLIILFNLLSAGIGLCLLGPPTLADFGRQWGAETLAVALWLGAWARRGVQAMPIRV